MDSLETTAQPSAAQHPTSDQGNPATGLRNSHTIQSPLPFSAEYRITSPHRDPVAELICSERAEPPPDVRVHPPDNAADFSPSQEPMATQSLQSGGAPPPSASLLISTMANTLGYGLHHTASTSMPHPLSPWSATVPSQPSTTEPLPFHTSNSPVTLPNTTHPYSNPQESHIQPASIQLSDSLPSHTSQPLSSLFDSQPPHTSHPLGSPFSSLPPFTSQALSSPLQVPLSGTPVSTAAISAISTPTAALHYPLSSGHLPRAPRSASSVSVPSDFHQLSFATPLIHAVQDTTAGSPAASTASHDHPLHVTVDETLFELETQERSYPLAHTHQLHVGEPAHYYSEASPELSSMLQPPTPYGVDTDATLQRLEANTDVPLQTQPLSEQLSIVTLETSHTHSEQPIGAPSPSPSSHSSSSEKEEETEEQCSSQSQDCTSDSDDSSYEEEEEGVDVNHGISPNDGEEEGPNPELGGGGVRNAIQLHHPALISTVGDNSIHELEETESSEVEVHSELRQHYKRSPDSNSSEDSDSSSNPSQHDRFMPLPEHSPKITQPGTRDDTQPHSPSLDDGSSDNSLFGALQGRSASPLSLQEAFLRRKEQFILKSKHRLEQLKENAQKRQAESSPALAHSTPRLIHHSGMPYKTLSPSNVRQGGRSHGLVTSSREEQRDADVRRRAVTFSSPLAVPQDTGTFNPPKFLGIVCYA